MEGGNVFGITAKIKKDNINPTVEKFIEQLSRVFPAKASTFKSFEKLGSAGKKDDSGDIDLSYDIKYIFPDGKTPDFEGWGVDEQKYNELVAQFTKRAKNATPEKIQLRAMIVLIGERINAALPDVEVNTKSSGSGAIFCAIPQYDTAGNKLDIAVQTDINIGNPDWLKFSYYSTTYKGNVKGLHRTQLMLAMFTQKDRIFTHATGVIDKATRTQEANTPQEAVALLNKLYDLNDNLTQDTLSDYFELRKFLEDNLDQSDYNNVIDIFLKVLDKTGPLPDDPTKPDKGTDIPEDIQEYWIANQDRLGLTGKFLPRSSKLSKYKKEA